MLKQRMCSGEPGALIAHARFCLVCGVDWALLPWER
jgi:hypothetical protein